MLQLNEGVGAILTAPRPYGILPELSLIIYNYIVLLAFEVFYKLEVLT